jgi:hypothetical protein
VALPGGYREGRESFNIWFGVALTLALIGLSGAYLGRCGGSAGYCWATRCGPMCWYGAESV